ncbi:MAG: DUF4340 domain-containing protein [Clostridiales bacterium]|nr:DUF4340 domain-containing protein [Clostridiales bacterium]
MKRKSRSTTLLILLGVLLVLIVATTAATLLNPDNQVEEVETVYLLSDLDTDAVTGLSWTYDGETVSLTSDGESWTDADDDSFPLDESYPESMVSALAEVTVTKTIEEPAELSEYGLEEPACTVTVTVDGEETELLIGDENTLDGGYYLSNGDGNVYIVDDSLLSTFTYSLYDLIEMETLPDLSAIRQVTVDAETQTLDIYYLEDSGLAYSDDYTWFLLDGEGYLTLDNDTTEALLDYVQSLSWESCADYNADEDELADYGLDEPTVTVTVAYTETVQVDTGETDDDGEAIYETDERDATFVLEIGDYCEGEYCYARIADSQMVYLIDADVCDVLLYTGYDDLRPDDILLMDWDTVTSAEITIDDVTYTVERTTQEVEDEDGETTEETVWLQDGEEVDIEGTLDDLNDLTATDSDDSATPERSAIASFTFHRNTDAYQTVTLTFYQYDSSSCLVELNGETRLFCDREAVEDIADELVSILTGEAEEEDTSEDEADTDTAEDE